MSEATPNKGIGLLIRDIDACDTRPNSASGAIAELGFGLGGGTPWTGSSMAASNQALSPQGRLRRRCVNWRPTGRFA